jgi:hypothetical protein
MISDVAKYHAECWAIGKSKAEIQAEINRIEAMWTLKIPHPFPKSAHDSYSRLVTLQMILESEELNKK